MGGRPGRSEAGCRGPALAGLLLVLAVASTIVPRAEAATTLRAFAVPDLTTVDPGDRVTFAIALDNLGPTSAAYAWANLTFPSNTRHMWDTGWPAPFSSGLWVSGNRRGYNFTGIPAGTNVTFAITMQILTGPADGTQLPVLLEVDYTDDTGAMQPRAVTTATLTMRIPNIVVTMTPTESSVNPGATFSYDIAVENTGSTTAGTVWLNDTLPDNVTFNGQNGLPPPQCSNEDCLLSTLRVGQVWTESYSLNVTVSPSATRGGLLVNYLFVNFTDPDGDSIIGPTAQATVDVRIVRDLTIAKVALAPVAFPGSTVTYRIWYNNTAAWALGTIWVNDTLPPGVTHDTSTPAGTVAGSAVLWQFPSVPPGPNAIDLVARVPTAALNGTALLNRVTADYVDASGVQGLRVEASANVTVSTSLPSFATFAKVASVREAASGDTVRYTIYYSNTGTAGAALVVIEDTIPPGTVLTNAVPAPAPESNRPHYIWRFSDVPPGNHSLSYDLVIQNTPAGTVLNYAFLNYTDQLGQLTYREGPRSASVRLAPGGDGSSLLPWLLVGVAGLAIAGFVAFRTLRAQKTVIDEVFLLHKDGLLIKHYTRRVRPDVDSDILSGMLIAVQNFVNESFIGAEGLQKEGKLDELRFGEFRMVIERGQWVVVAAVLSGDPTDRIKVEVKAAIEDLEGALGDRLEGWSGEMNQVEDADAYIQDLIAGKYRRAWGKG